MIFLDIETVAMAKDYSALSPRWASLWDQRHESRELEGEPAESFRNSAALHPEFARVVSVAIATIHGGSVVGFVSAGDDEVGLLKVVAEKLSTRKTTAICAHCGTGFDFPFLIRRFVANFMAKEIPLQLQIEGKKPWEILWQDTNVIWSCGKFGGGVTLDLLCEVLGVPSLKAEVDGSSVHQMFYENQWDKLRKYNAADVTALARCYAIMHGQPSPAKATWTGSYARVGGETLGPSSESSRGNEIAKSQESASQAGGASGAGSEPTL